MADSGYYRHSFVQGLAEEIKALRAEVVELKQQRDGAVAKAEGYRLKLAEEEKKNLNGR